MVINKFNNTEYDVAAFKPNEFLDLVVTKSKYEEILSQGFDKKLDINENIKNAKLEFSKLFNKT